MKEKAPCKHNALRRGDSTRETFNKYVCGNCAKVFEVEEHIPPAPLPPEPMNDGRKPWGYRDRQA